MLSCSFTYRNHTHRLSPDGLASLNARRALSVLTYLKIWSVGLGIWIWIWIGLHLNLNQSTLTHFLRKYTYLAIHSRIRSPLLAVVVIVFLLVFVRVVRVCLLEYCFLLRTHTRLIWIRLHTNNCKGALHLARPGCCVDFRFLIRTCSCSSGDSKFRSTCAACHCFLF